MTYTIKIAETSPKAKSIIEMFKMLAVDYDFLQITETEDLSSLSDEHKKLLDNRLEKIEKGESTFKNWDIIKQK